MTQNAHYTSYLYGTIAVAIVSLLSLSGVALLPCLSKRVFVKVKLFLVALSIGTLTADAILHLLPAAIGLHNHEDHDKGSLSLRNHSSHSHESEEGHDHGSHEHGVEKDQISHDEIQPYMWKLLVVVLCCYGLWLLESIHRCLSSHSHARVKPDVNGGPMTIRMTDLGSEVTSPSSYETPAASNLMCGLKPAAFSILLGDSLHNLCDGFAMGAAFATSPALGVTTSIAVATHELPHELGDFVILLQSGLSRKWALILNLLSALFAFLGLYPGIALTASIKSSEQFIFAAIAGMFLYIALVDMAQELCTMEEANTIVGALLHNSGMLAGIAILALLAIYEESLYEML